MPTAARTPRAAGGPVWPGMGVASLAEENSSASPRRQCGQDRHGTFQVKTTC
ncbi:hypothetical protein [Mycobacterium servetii]|uniref:Uncharacterized protein n=1 Tax=Mycobacterium servetii TaxID=3237418 RepID=A0ABV4C1L4_9MYCO